MLEFRKISIDDKRLIDGCLHSGNTDGSSYSFGSLFCWGEGYSVEMAEYEGFVLIRGSDDYGRYYAYPSGKGDVKKAVDALLEDCRNDGEIFRLVQMLEVNKIELEALYPDLFSITYSRDFSEYVYSVKNMAELSGKKFHSKKSHVNAFFRNHSDVSCDPITGDNISYCLDIARVWLSEKESGFGLDAEFRAIKKAVDNYDALGYEGAILFADGKPVAFTMGEKLKNNTFCTHFEKTLPDYRDAYPVINNGFTKLMLAGYDFVNREEDLGLEGLRKAKLSYQPVFLVDKYTAVLRNDPSRKFAVTNDDIPDLKNLWKTVFGDDDGVIGFFFTKTVDTDDIYAYKRDGRIVSAFYLIDAPLVIGSHEIKAKYLYAAATHPDYRNFGIMGDMIKYALNYVRINDYKAVYLYPAEERLYDYYSKFGFIKSFRCRIYELGSAALEKYKNQRYFNTTLSYAQMRNCVPSENYAKFGESYLDFARFCTLNGGFEESFLFDDGDKVFVIGHYKDNVMYVDEAFSSDCNYAHVLGVLADSKYGKIYLKTPVDIVLDDFVSSVADDGMINKSADGDEVYYLGQPCM